LVILYKSYEPPKLQNNIGLGFQENTLKFLGKMSFWWAEVQSILWGLHYLVQIQGTMSLCVPTQKRFKYTLITLLINCVIEVTKKKFMNHSFSSHPKPPTSLVLLHKTKEHSSSCCHFAIVVEIKELHDWNLASNLKPHEPWVQSTLVHGTRLYYKMSFHSICHKQGHETRKDIFFVFVHMVEFMFEHVLLWLSKIFFGCSNFHVCNNTLIIRRL